MRSLTALLLITLAAGGAFAQTDEEAITQAVLNYANSAYDVNPELVVESVHPHLQKVGFVPARDGDGYRTLWMNFYELYELVESWNTGGQFDPKTAKREVKVLDKLDQIAVARLDAEWGVDFFHLALIEGNWQIVNVIWQTYPADQSPEK